MEKEKYIKGKNLKEISKFKIINELFLIIGFISISMMTLLIYINYIISLSGLGLFVVYCVAFYLYDYTLIKVYKLENNLKWLKQNILLYYIF